MNSTTYMGMDVEQAREVATAVADCGTRIAELIEEAGTEVRAMDWVGPDADHYQQAWTDFVSQTVSKLTDALSRVSEDISTHADDQDATSLRD